VAVVMMIATTAITTVNGDITATTAFQSRWR
jgi:hypothetical protein